MDKYQLNLFKKIKFIKLNSPLGDGMVEYNDSELILIQNENYNITKYSLLIDDSLLQKIVVDGNEYKGEIIIDFNTKINEIKFFFKNNLVDVIALKLSYVFSDREKYDLKVAVENREKMLKEMNPKIRIGNRVANIHWIGVTKNYDYMILTVFALIDDKEMLMEKNKVSNGVFFKSLIDLAPGDYKVSLEACDKYDNKIVDTNLFFTMVDPYSSLLEQIKMKIGSRTIRNL